MKKLEAVLKTGKLITDLLMLLLLLGILALPITSIGLLQVKKDAVPGVTNMEVLSKQTQREVDPKTLPSSADLPEDTSDEFNNFEDFENYLLNVYSED